MLTKEYLEEVFYYDDGVLRWKKKTGKSVVMGKEAGHTDNKGYRRIRLFGRLEGVHRLIFLLFNGYLPEVVDHIDRDKMNNRIENLRACTKAQNEKNRVKYKNNKTGVKNVYQIGNSYCVDFKLKGVRQFSKCCKTLEEATRLAYEMRKQLHGEFTCDG
jgi:hypothetical protein